MGNQRLLKVIKLVVLILVVLCMMSASPAYIQQTFVSSSHEEVKDIVDRIYKDRACAIISGDLELIESSYNKSTKFGMWAYEYEIRRMKYLQKWEEKQGIDFTSITPTIVIRNVKGGRDSYSLNLLLSTQYQYVYKDRPSAVNTGVIGTYHILNIKKDNGLWFITKEWYKDPFGDYLCLGDVKAEEIRKYILSQETRDLSNIGERREKAIQYADTYCGAASNGNNNYKYNTNYKDFNAYGGDCANFASQILHEGGGFRKNGTWNYRKGEASKAWVNADGFNGYMICSGRGSLIAYGSYEKVYKASYKLLPGDYVAYEDKNDITHISVVTGADSRGYTLVSCHNTDRNKVPWDLGWGGKNIKFYLVRVHF